MLLISTDIQCNGVRLYHALKFAHLLSNYFITACSKMPIDVLDSELYKNYLKVVKNKSIYCI